MFNLTCERQVQATEVLNLLKEEKIGTPEDPNLERRGRINRLIKALRPVVEKEAKDYPAPGLTANVGLTLLKLGACQELVQRFTLEYFIRFKKADVSLIFANNKQIGSGDNHSFCLIGKVIVDDALIIGRGSHSMTITKSESFIPIEKFLSQQQKDTLVVDPLLEFSGIANGSCKILLDYCKDHSITHVAAVRQYSNVFVENAQVIKANAELVADKIKPSLAEENVIKASTDPKKFLAELIQKFKLNSSDIENVKIREQALRRAAMEVGTQKDISILLSIGVDINAQDDNPKKRNTALHVAILYKNFENATFLIKEGAKKDIANADGITANDLILQLPAGTIK